MPNRYPLRAVSIVDRPASAAERRFAVIAITLMMLTTAVLVVM